MKKILKLNTLLIFILAMMLAVFLCACTVPDVQVQNPDGSPTLGGVVIEQTVNIAFRFIEAAVMIFAAWALKKFGNNKNMQSISTAIQLVCDMAIQTAGELQQKVVDKMKEKSPDGKLTSAQINFLTGNLLNMTKAKLSEATKALVVASGADLDAIITGACENLLSIWKGSFGNAAHPVPLEGDYDATEGKTV